MRALIIFAPLFRSVAHDGTRPQRSSSARGSPFGDDDREDLLGGRDVVAVRARVARDRDFEAVVQFFRARGVGVAAAHGFTLFASRPRPGGRERARRARGRPAATGWRKSPLLTRCMPRRSITRRERSLPRAVNDTSEPSASVLERVARHGGGGLGGEPPPPVRPREAPADLDRGRERHLRIDAVKPRPADQRCLAGQLERPQAEPVLLEVRLDAVDQRAALLHRERARQELDHLRVAVELGERLEVRRAPAAQQQPRASQFRG